MHLLHVYLASAWCVIFAVYLATLSPSIAGGDSGEIVAEGCSLGTAHPPGYPLLTMLIHFIDVWLPFGSVAYRINVLSAALTAFAAVCIGYCVYLYQPQGPTPIYSSITIAMGLFSFSPLIWQYATTAEVFPLNTAFAALILLLVVVFAKYRHVWIAYIGAFVCGLVRILL